MTTNQEQHPIRQLQQREWPPLLRADAGVVDAPKLLYCRGTTPNWKRKLITIVGSRKHSDYGKRVCEKIIADLAQYPVTIVSGLALGIDAIAHRSALQNNIPTIGVVGSGLDTPSLYPKTNTPLAQEMLETGNALLSEYAAGMTVKPYTFPRRNRIMAGMSVITVVIECTSQSGTRITARLALEYGREVCAVPHDIFSRVGCGTNILLGEGAHVVQSGHDIAELIGFDNEESVSYGKNAYNNKTTYDRR